MSENIFCYPDAMEQNDYLNQNIKTWEGLGYTVMPWKSLLKKILVFRFWNRDILILNFYENIIMGNNPFLRLLLGSFFLLLAKIVTRKIIWVRHNYVPHDLSDSRNYFFIIFVRLINVLCDCVITHRPTSEVKADYVVPHPLYDVDINRIDTQKEPSIPFLYFGLVRRYKGLTELLTIWPEDCKLVILGFCNDRELEYEIMNIINNRKLDVQWTNMFFSKEALNEKILSSKFVVIPHVDNSMIVTGSLFHAISLGANLLIKDGEFGRWARNEYPFVNLFDKNKLTSNLLYLRSTKKSEVRRFAEKINGPELQKNIWKEILEY